MADLIEDLDLVFSGKGPEMEIHRGLVPADLPHLQPVSQEVPTLQKITANHHRLAQLMVKGGNRDVELSALTGYSPTYISLLRKQPAFQELLATYQGQREEIFVDVMERMKLLGLSTLDDLQGALEDGKLTIQQKIDMVELLLVKAKKAEQGVKGPGPGGTSPVQINVNFRDAPRGPTVIEAAPLGRIEG